MKDGDLFIFESTTNPLTSRKAHQSPAVGLLVGGRTCERKSLAERIEDFRVMILKHTSASTNLPHHALPHHNIRNSKQPTRHRLVTEMKERLQFSSVVQKENVLWAHSKKITDCVPGENLSHWHLDVESSFNRTMEWSLAVHDTQSVSFSYVKLSKLTK